MALQEDNLSHSCSSNLKETDGLSNKLDCGSKHKLQLETQVGINIGHTECNLKQETEAVSFQFEQTKKELDGHLNMHSDIKDDTVEDGIHRVFFKKEPEDMELDIQDHYLSVSCSNHQEAIDSLSTKVDFAREYNNINVVNTVDVTNDVGHGINCATCKQEPEDLKFQLEMKEHHLSESCLNAQKDIRSSLIKLDFASEHNSEVKNEAGCDDGPRVCNLKQDAVKFGIRRPKSEINIFNSVQFYIKNNPHDEMQVCEGRFYKNLIDQCETHNKNNFQNHSTEIDNETGKESFQCYLCELEFKLESSLKTHIEYKHSKIQKESSKIYQCQFCQYKSKNKSSFNKHINYNHNESAKRFQCSLCIYKAKKLSHLKNHYKNKHDETPELHHCQFCEYKTTNKDSLQKHIKRNHDENAKWFQCSFCIYKTKYKSALIKHFKRKHDENAEMHQCQFCEYKSKHKGSLKSHFIHNHSESAQWFQCSFCIYNTTYRQDLRHHVRVKHDRDRKKYQCQFCESRYKYERDLRQHIRIKHAEDVRWYHCNYCDYKTIYKQSLKPHLKAKHSENCEIYPCCFCNCKYKYKHALERHVDCKHNKNAHLC